MKNSALYNRVALGLSTLVLAGCQTLQKPNTDTCMQERSFRAIFFNTGGTTYNTDCNDGRTAYALLARQGDPVGNALGFLLYMDQNKQAKANLEARLGGKDKVKVAPETVAGLMLSSDPTSRYLGLQIYTAQPEETRINVSDIILAEKKEPKAVIAAIMAENKADQGQGAENLTRDWAHEHAKAPQGIAATTCAATTGCKRAITGSGVTYTFPKQP